MACFGSHLKITYYLNIIRSDYYNSQQAWWTKQEQVRQHATGAADQRTQATGTEADQRTQATGTAADQHTQATGTVL